MDGDTVSVERTIAAPPEKIFALLSDAGKHQAFDGSGTVIGSRRTDARAKAERLRIGSEFGMSMKQGLPYSTVNTVIEYEDNLRIAWQTVGSGFLGQVIGGRIWRYELEATDAGTLVRETWDLSQDRQAFLIKRSKLPSTTERNMQRTLERIEREVT